MGKEWYLGGRSSKSKRSNGHMVIDRDTNNINTTTSAGCMCAVFHFFDFQFASNNLQNQNELQPSILKPKTTTSTTTIFTPFELPDEEPNIPKGAEAPRNSLKSEEGTSLSSIIEDEEVLESLNNIQMGINHIKTSSRSNDFGSDTSSNSPGTKTPSLVARLMGLDLLPDQTASPASSHQFAHSPTVHKLASSSSRPNKAKHLISSETAYKQASGTRSLPETPRVSSSSSRRSDVDNQHHHHHHRLSLQINKENSGLGEDLDFSRLSSLRRKQLKANNYHNDENNPEYNSAKSPGYYARQIVKQVKESVTRRVGSDITNTVKTRSENNQYYSRRDYDLVNKTVKRSSSSISKGSPKLEEQATVISSSCSPRLRISESKTTTTTTIPSTAMNKDQISVQVPKPSSVKPEREQEKGRRNTANKAGNGRRVIRQKIMQEETFVFGPKSKTVKTSTSNRRGGNSSVPDKSSKSKKTPLSNDLLNLNIVVPSLVALKKNTARSDHDDQFVMITTSEKKKQRGPGAADNQVPESKRTRPITSLLSSSSSSETPHVPNPNRTCSTTDPHAALRRYVARILGRTGVSATSHVSFTNWFSPSHPLDPSIFHRLEIYYSTHFIHNTNPNSHGQLLSLRCNRKLVFDVLDEALVEILRPYISLKPWIHYVKNYYNHTNNNVRSKSGSNLIEALCERVEGFPCKDCQVLEDIDALIDEDLRESNRQSQKEMAFEEEGEGLVMEIEKDLVDTLVHETALILFWNWN